LTGDESVKPYAMVKTRWRFNQVRYPPARAPLSDFPGAIQAPLGPRARIQSAERVAI